MGGLTLLEHFPVLARLPCAECQTYRIDYDWEHHRGTGNREKSCGEDWKREGPDLPICMNPDGSKALDEHGAARCPKGHPREEHESRLSPRNRATLEIYQQVQATNGACLTEQMRRDKLLMRNLSIVHRVVEAARQQQAAKQMGDYVGLAVARLFAEK
jgi:hypothetical protein